MRRVTLPAVLLHGFAGAGQSWDAVRAELAASGADLHTPDLPGHGTRSDDRPVSFDACVDAALADAPDTFILCGYSMGGRVALHVALAVPERVRALVLVATTAGIEDAGEREARQGADAALADAIEAAPIEDFAERWSRQPLFAGDPPEVLAAWHQQLLRNGPAGLAASLRGVGTGSMSPLWDRLGELTMPALVLAGQRDAKYTAIGERLAAELPDAQLTIVPGAGHGLPREAPAAVAQALCSV